MIRHREIPALDIEGSPLLVDEKRAAQLLGVSLSYLRKSRCEGQRGQRMKAPKFVCVGCRRLYRATDLRDWIENLASFNSLAEVDGDE